MPPDNGPPSAALPTRPGRRPPPLGGRPASRRESLGRLVGAVVATVAAPRPDAWATRAADADGTVLFQSAGRICRVNVDGSAFRILPIDAPRQVSWQPAGVLDDGRLLLLSMEPRRDGPGRPFDEYYHRTPTHIWAYDGASDTLTELATRDREAAFCTPQLVLPGGRLLVQVIRERPGSLVSMRLDGSDARPFPTDAGLPYGLALRPDGRRVAFHLAGPDGYQIWTSDLEGGDRVRIAADPQRLCFGPAWSPDGASLAYEACLHAADPGHDWADVCVARADGSAARDVTDGQAMWFGATYGRPGARGGGSNVPVWSPDGGILFPERQPGSKVAWEYQPSRPDTDHFNRDFKPEAARGGTSICRIDPDTRGRTPLTPATAGLWDFRVAPSPDGRWITFCRAATGDVPALWAARSDGSDPRPLSRGIDDGGVDHPRWWAGAT